MTGKLNDRMFAVVEGKLGYAEFKPARDEDGERNPIFTPAKPGDAHEALTYLSAFNGETVKASVTPRLVGVEVFDFVTKNGGKYTAIRCEDIQKLLKAGYVATMYANFYNNTPFLNLAFRLEGAKATRETAVKANKFAKAPEAKPAPRGKFTAKR